MSDVLRGNINGLDEDGSLDDLIDRHPSIILRLDNREPLIGLLAGMSRDRMRRAVRMRLNLVEALELMADDRYASVAGAVVDLGPTVVEYTCSDRTLTSLELVDIEMSSGMCTLVVSFSA